MFLLGTIHAPCLYETKKNFPPLGTRRRSGAEIIDVTLDTARVSSLVVRTEGLAPQHVLNIWTQGGQVAFERNQTTPGEWTLWPRQDEKWRKALRAEQLNIALQPAILAFEGLCEQLPEDHLPAQPLDSMTMLERLMITRQFPDAGDLPTVVKDQFGGCLLAMAEGLTDAQATDQRVTEAADRAKRLRQQFDLLPAGTILVERGYSHLAIVSDKRGRRSKRSLQIRRGLRTTPQTMRDIDKTARHNYCLLTTRRIKNLPAGVFQAQDIKTAVRQAQAFRKRCPDLG